MFTPDFEILKKYPKQSFGANFGRLAMVTEWRDCWRGNAVCRATLMTAHATRRQAAAATAGDHRRHEIKRHQLPVYTAVTSRDVCRLSWFPVPVQYVLFNQPTRRRRRYAPVFPPTVPFHSVRVNSQLLPIANLALCHAVVAYIVEEGHYTTMSNSFNEQIKPTVPNMSTRRANHTLSNSITNCTSTWLTVFFCSVT